MLNGDDSFKKHISVIKGHYCYPNSVGHDLILVLFSMSFDFHMSFFKLTMKILLCRIWISLHHALFVLSFDFWFFFFPFHKWLFTICQNTWGWQKLPWCKSLSLLTMILQIFDQDIHSGYGAFCLVTRIDISESWK
jgi:hypothetical protein